MGVDYAQRGIAGEPIHSQSVLTDTPITATASHLFEWHLDETDIGAEVVLCGSDMSPKLSRRCSYEEVVHPDNDCSVHLDSMKLCLLKLTHWALALQNVYEDQRQEVGKACSKCVCAKVENVQEHLTLLQLTFKEVLSKNLNLLDLAVSMQKVQSILRSHVTIQVSAMPDFEAQSKADYVVSKIVDIGGYVEDAIGSIRGLVNDIMNIHGCACKNSSRRKRKQVFPKTATDEEPKFMIISSPTARKRPTSPTLPIKRAKAESLPILSHQKRPSSNPLLMPVLLPTVQQPEPAKARPMIEFLEYHRKTQRSDGLYRWVLWKEALTDSLLRYSKQEEE